MQASQLGVGGMNRGIKGIWKRKGLSSGLNIHPELQADVDSKIGLLRQLRRRRRWCIVLERCGFGQTLSSSWA